MEKTRKISLILTEEEYRRLHSLKYRVEGASSTHSGIARAWLQVLLDAAEDLQSGEVLGLSSGVQQRTRRVVLRRRWGDRMEIVPLREKRRE